MTDPHGDATVAPADHQSIGVGVVPSDPSLDIVSADLALHGRTLVATIKPKRLTDPNPASPAGQSFTVIFRVNGEQPITIAGWVTAVGRRAQVTDGTGYAQTAAYPADVRFDASRSVVTLTAALSDISSIAPVARGTRLTDIIVGSARVVGASNQAEALVFVDADFARTEKTYVVGTPTRCR